MLLALPDPRSSIPALFYRHWLELRTMTLVICGLALFAALGYGFAVSGAAGYYAKTGVVTAEIARYEAIRQMSPGPDLVPAAVHILVTAFFALWVSGIFSGSGLGTPHSLRLNAPRHPSVYFTVSLPISRTGLLVSRLAAGMFSLCAVLVVSLAAHVIALLVIRQPIPIGAMAGTSLMAAMGGLGLMTLARLVNSLTSEALGGFLTSMIMVTLWFTDEGWNRTVGVVDQPHAPTLAGVLAASATLAALSVAVVRRKDL